MIDNRLKLKYLAAFVASDAANAYKKENNEKYKWQMIYAEMEWNKYFDAIEAMVTVNGNP